MNENKPFFSVIMACYNAESFIGLAVQSVLRQTFDSWELLIVDDASSDGSYEVATRFGAVDQRVKVYRLDINSGAGFARNVAVEKASGEWLAILDADDIYLPDKLKRQYDFIISSSQPNLVLLGTGVHCINSCGEPMGTFFYPKSSKGLKDNLYRMNRFPPHSSMVYRSCALKEIGGFNTQFLRSQDYDLWLRLSEKGGFASLRTPLVQYRVHTNGVSSNLCVYGFSQYIYSVAANVNDRILRYGLHAPIHDPDLFRIFVEVIRNSYIGSRYEKAHGFWRTIQKLKSERKFIAIGLLIAASPFLTVFIICERLGLLSFTDAVFKKCIRDNCSVITNMKGRSSVEDNSCAE